MIMCSCGVVSDRDIRLLAMKHPDEKFARVAKEINAVQACGRCGTGACDLFKLSQRRLHLIKRLRLRAEELRKCHL